WRAPDPVRRQRDWVAGALVVEREATIQDTHRERPGRHLDGLQAGVAAWSRRRRTKVRRAVPGRPGETKRLQHRLVVLVLVADDHLVHHGVAGAAAGERLQRALAHLLHVLARCGG